MKTVRRKKELVEDFIKRSNKVHTSIYPLLRALASLRLFLPLLFLAIY